VTENRPFYELDDDEMLIEEAADAALSETVTPLVSPVIVPPALPLRSVLDVVSTQALIERFERKATLTLLDHAYLINCLACKLTSDGKDTFGFATALGSEAALLLLDAERSRNSSRSIQARFPDDGIAAFTAANLDYSGKQLPGLSVRFERNALVHFTKNFAQSTAFFAFRRFSLALMPTLTNDSVLTDTLEAYAASARVLINTAAAKQAILPWEQLALVSDTNAERDARLLLSELGCFRW